MSNKKEIIKNEIVEEKYGEGTNIIRCIVMLGFTVFIVSIIGLFVGILFALLNIYIDLGIILNKTMILSIIMFWMFNVRVGFIENLIYENKKHKPFKIWFGKMYSYKGESSRQE